MIRIIIAPLLILALLSCNKQPAYVVAAMPVPVWNVSDISSLFGGNNRGTLVLDKQQQMLELEFVALPGSLFRIHGTVVSHGITMYRVTTNEYPCSDSKKYFIDARMVKPVMGKAMERQKVLPDRTTVISRLKKANGSIYIWGSNTRKGIPQMLSLYPPTIPLTPVLKKRWQLQGVDCSGLLYEATGGFTPRNTSELITFGAPVHIAGLNPEQIREKLKPLDLIVWKGHVIIVLDQHHTIDSRLVKNEQGVRIRKLPNLLTNLMLQKRPVNDYSDEREGKQVFVVRRWYPGKVTTGS